MSKRQLFELHDLPGAQAFLRQFPAAARQRGKQLCLDGAVTDVLHDVTGNEFTATVQAQWPFTIRVYYQTRWRTECDCGQRFDCEHGYAAMRTLLDRQNAIPADLREDPDNKPPPSALEQQLKEKRVRKLLPDERRFLRNVQELYRRCKDQGRIHGWDLNQLGFYTFVYGQGDLYLWPAMPQDDE